MTEPVSHQSQRRNIGMAYWRMYLGFIEGSWLYQAKQLKWEREKQPRA